MHLLEKLQLSFTAKKNEKEKEKAALTLMLSAVF